MSARIGRAGDYLVASALELIGVQVAVVRADDFDLVAWTPAEAYRIEVKTAGKRSKQKTNQYHFDTRSGRTRRPMSGCDVVAFCALDIRMVVFRALAAVPTTSTLVPAQSFSVGYELDSWQAAIRI